MVTRFRVVNSSEGTYWVDDTATENKLWPTGMGLTFCQRDYGEKDGSFGKLNPDYAKRQADRVCQCLNELFDAYDTSKHPCTADEAAARVTRPFVHVQFQNGTVRDKGINGVQVEDVVEIARQRLAHLNRAPNACRENALALTKLEEANMWLERRTKLRQQQGVEGTQQPHSS